MSTKLVRANIQRYSTNDFDEYGDPNPIYALMVNGKKLTLKTRGKKLPTGIDFSQKFEFIFEVTSSDEIVAFYSPLQELKWGSQSQIRTLTGSKKQKLIYQFVTGTVTDKRSKTETINTHLPRNGTQNTMERRTTYFINISGRTYQGSSSYKKVKTGDQVTGVANQYGYLEMLRNSETGKKYGLFSIWPMIIALLVTVLMNVFFLADESLNAPVKTVFGSFPEYYEKMVFFNLAAIPISIMTIIWTRQRFKVLSFFNQQTSS